MMDGFVVIIVAIKENSSWIRPINAPYFEKESETKQTPANHFIKAEVPQKERVGEQHKERGRQKRASERKRERKSWCHWVTDILCILWPHQSLRSATEPWQTPLFNLDWFSQDSWMKRQVWFHLHALVI